MTVARELSEALATTYASLMPPPSERKADIEAALDAARERLGVQRSSLRRDGLPREQTTLDLR